MRFPCLVLDHDDTVVQSEMTVNFPYFLQVLNAFRPGQTTTAEEYARECNRVGFADFCRQRFHFTEQEILDEYMGWKEYVKTHIPDPFPGIANVIRRQRAAGGKICVVSHSCNENITRDYALHFGIQPDDIFGWDLPEDKRKPSAGGGRHEAGLHHGEKAERAHRLRRLGPPELPGDLQGNACALQLLLRYPPAAGRISVWRLRGSNKK